jgi:hypothetical protein
MAGSNHVEVDPPVHATRIALVDLRGDVQRDKRLRSPGLLV